MITGGVFVQDVNELLDDIVAAIKSDTTIETLEVTRDALVEGRTCEHKVDLYWKFTSHGIVYQALIDASHFDEEKINKKMLFQAFSAANDINGQVVGVLLTRSIMDSAVKELADKSRIILCEVGEGTSKYVLEPVVERMSITFDTEWITAEKERLGIAGQKINFQGNPKYLFLYDAEDNCIDSLEGTVQTVLSQKAQSGYFDLEEIDHRFEQDMYLKIDDEYFPKVKILGIVLSASIRKSALVGMGDIVNDIRVQVEKQFLQ